MRRPGRLRWVVPVVFGFFLIAFLAFFVLATGFQRSAEIRAAQQNMSYYSGMGPGYEKIAAAEAKGPDGYADLQALMLDTDVGVAFQAANVLLRNGVFPAVDKFFEQLPKVTTQVKESVRMGGFDQRAFARAADRVKERDPKTMQGAMLFLKLSYMRDGYGYENQAFDTLVTAIPDYDGAEADELAYTISLFQPKSVQPLIDMLGHEKARARLTAAIALGKMERAEALDGVTKLKSDPDPAVRAAAARAKKRIEGLIAYMAARPPMPVMSRDGRSIVDPLEERKARNRLGMP